MNLKNRKKEIRKLYFSTGGLVVVSILGSFGLLLVFLSGILEIENYKILYDCISRNGMMIIFGLFFFCISLYCWIGFFRNIILNPKKEILYLYKNEENEIFFINKKGKKFIYNECNKEENKYYFVMKTHDYIYEVLEECNESFNNLDPKEKKSYWLNFYSPIGKFEDILLLPIIYIAVLPGILSFIMSKGYQKIYGIIFSAIPLYIIVYDLIYKIKLKKSGTITIDTSKGVNSYRRLENIIAILGAGILSIILINIFLKLSDFTSRVIFAPFLGCGLCTFGLSVAKAFKNYKFENIFLKGYIIIFLIYWFGFLIFGTITIIKQEGSYLYGLFLFPFWLAGFFTIYKYFIKK